MLNSDCAYYRDSFTAIKTNHKIKSPVAWALEKRVLPEGTTPFPGSWRLEVAPYVEEILNHFSPDSETREVAVVKGAQTTLTVSVAENVIGYNIDENACSQMYVTADEKLVKGRMDLTIDRMIDSAGLREKIFSQTDTTHKKSKKTGDTQLRKEYPGGFLLAASIKSASSGRSFSVPVMIIDEVDAADVELKKDGDPIGVFKARTNAYERIRKLLYISTPLEKTTSKIWPLFELGDQRYFNVPCPHCGFEQVLKFSNLKFKYKNGSVIEGTVYYECANESCSAKIYNDDKLFMLKRGKWKATARAKRPGLVSYHLSALYSPIGFLSWESIAQQWVEAETARMNGDVSLLRVFINTVLGECWEERGEAPRYELVMASRTSYMFDRYRIPEDVLFMTAGADAHAGRIETELVGWGEGARSWSLDYAVLKGDLEGRGVWEQLTDFFVKSRMTINGRELVMPIAFIDSGYKPDIVYEYCSLMNGVFPCMGQPTQNIKSFKNAFKMTALESFDVIRYDLNVNDLKDTLYTQLKRGLREDETAPPGFCHFPMDYRETYFRQLTAEEKIVETDKYGNKRYRWARKGYRSNEALDCRIYAIGALYAFAYNVCVEIMGLESIQWEFFWSYVQSQMAA
jgi:phage terminase large subunit GpA-like protein